MTPRPRVFTEHDLDMLKHDVLVAASFYIRVDQENGYKVGQLRRDPNTPVTIPQRYEDNFSPRAQRFLQVAYDHLVSYMQYRLDAADPGPHPFTKNDAETLQLDIHIANFLYDRVDRLAAHKVALLRQNPRAPVTIHCRYEDNFEPTERRFLSLVCKDSERYMDVRVEHAYRRPNAA